MKRRAIYEAAAERIASGERSFCCSALEGVLLGSGRWSEINKFRGVFGLQLFDTFECMRWREGWETPTDGPIDPDVRVMALCLAYSVLTYRRPKSRPRKRRFR